MERSCCASRKRSTVQNRNEAAVSSSAFVRRTMLSGNCLSTKRLGTLSALLARYSDLSDYRVPCMKDRAQRPGSVTNGLLLGLRSKYAACGEHEEADATGSGELGALGRRQCRLHRVRRDQQGGGGGTHGRMLAGTDNTAPRGEVEARRAVTDD